MDNLELDISKQTTSQTVSAQDLKCDVCDRQFDRKSRLEAHYKIHTGERPFSCPFCGKSFTSKGNCNTHIRIHTRERPYQCTHCDRKFSQHGQLVIHIRRHTGEKPYVCIHCNKGFTCSKVLKIHIRTHTGEKPFECEHCQKGFAAYANLVVHRRTHTRERPYSCKLCGRGFEHSGNLSRHVRVHRVENGVRCIPCGQIFSTDANLISHTQQIHPHESDMIDDPLDINDENLSPGNLSSDQMSPPDDSNEIDLNMCQDEDSNGYQPQIETINMTSYTNISDDLRKSPISTEVGIDRRTDFRSISSIKKTDNDDSGRESGDSVVYAREIDKHDMDDLNDNKEMFYNGHTITKNEFITNSACNSIDIKNQDPSHLPINEHKTNVCEKSEEFDFERNKRESMFKMPPKKQNHQGRHKNLSVLRAALFSPLQKSASSSFASSCKNSSGLVNNSIENSTASVGQTISCKTNPVQLNTAITNLSISHQEYHSPYHSSYSSQMESSLSRPSEESEILIKTSTYPIDLTMTDELNKSEISSPLNLSHKNTYLENDKRHHMLHNTTETTHSLSSSNLRRKADSIENDKECVKMRKIIPPPPLIPLIGADEKDTNSCQSRNSSSEHSFTQPTTDEVHQIRNSDSTLKTSMPKIIHSSYKKSKLNVISNNIPKEVDIPNQFKSNHNSAFKRYVNTNQEPVSEVDKINPINSETYINSELNGSYEETFSQNTLPVCETDKNQIFPIESVRENIQRSLKALVPVHDDDFKKRSETAVLFLVGDSTMRHLGYPGKNTEQVLITILDMAGKSPCADVRVNELERLKINMYKFLEYGFPSKTSWDEYGWTEKPIELILDIILTWITRKRYMNNQSIIVPSLSFPVPPSNCPFKENINSSCNSTSSTVYSSPVMSFSLYQNHEKNITKSMDSNSRLECRQDLDKFKKVKGMGELKSSPQQFSSR